MAGEKGEAGQDITPIGVQRLRGQPPLGAEVPHPAHHRRSRIGGGAGDQKREVVGGSHDGKVP